MLVFASSSSVYGDQQTFPTPEDAPTIPVSPYGVTKLTAERLCDVYSRSYGVPLVVLRYFTAYGPGQRPDMAFHRFIAAIAKGERIREYGRGEQSRDFTYVDDAVGATILATKARPGQVFNVGSGVSTSIREVVATIESLMGGKAKVSYMKSRLGDAQKTCADISRIRNEVGFEPSVKLREGLESQIRWQLRKADW